ncbi:MAG: hypothetical protein ACRESE_03660 [Gammaproteobacteria bacterium]
MKLITYVIVGLVWIVLAILAIPLGIIGLLLNLPDFKRYMRIRSM